MVLLDLFLKIQKQYQLQINVVHINHGLRGKRANQDEAFVRSHCNQAGILCYTIQGNVPQRVIDHQQSLEEGARSLRFEVFNELSQKLKINKIALGHHADDQAETVFLHMIQGAGIRGLRGILPQRDNVIHPLLFAHRDEITTYASEHQIPFIDDESNASRKMLRNRIRHDLLPAIEQSLNLNSIEGLNHSATYLAEAEQFIKHHIQIAYEACVSQESFGEIVLDIDRYKGYFSIVQSGILTQIIESIHQNHQSVRRFEIERAKSLIASGRSGAETMIGQKIKMIRTTDSLVFKIDRHNPSFKEIMLNTKVVLDDFFVSLENTTVAFEQIDENERKNKNVEYLDCDTLELPMAIRTFQPGDRFRPIGMKKFKKVHDFFIDEKIPNYKRKQIPLLVDHDDQIVWICGYRLDDRNKITKQTKRVIRLETSPIS